MMPGPIGRLDHANTMLVETLHGTFQGEGDLAMLNGAGAVAVETVSGGYEIIQFAHSRLNSSGSWQLSGLLRGQLGTEIEMSSGALAGARVVMLDDAHWNTTPFGK